MSRTITLLAALLLASLASAQQAAVGPVIQTPQTPIKSGVLSDSIAITGLTTEQLADAKLRCYPSAGVLCRGARGWDGGTFVLFQATQPGEYSLVLVVQSDEPGGDVFAEATVIVSAGTHPPNPPDPPAPNPGRRQAIILWESSEISGDQAQLRLDSRTDAAFLASLAQSQHPSPLFLDPDQESPVVSKLLTAAEAAGKTLPLLFVLDYSAGTVGDVLAIDVVPDTVDGILAAIRKAGG